MLLYLGMSRKEILCCLYQFFFILMVFFHEIPYNFIYVLHCLNCRPDDTPWDGGKNWEEPHIILQFLSRLMFKLHLLWYFWVFQVRLSWHFNSQRIIQISHQQCVLFLGCFIQIVSSKQKLHTHMYAHITFVHVLVHMCTHTTRNICMFIEYWIIVHPFT